MSKWGQKFNTAIRESVACPTCNAPAGESCLTSNGKLTSAPHVPRRDLYVARPRQEEQQEPSAP